MVGCCAVIWFDWLVSISGERDRWAGVGGGALRQTDLPVSISRDSDQMDTTLTSSINTVLIMPAVTSQTELNIFWTLRECSPDVTLKNKGTGSHGPKTSTDFYFESFKKHETWENISGTYLFTGWPIGAAGRRSYPAETWTDLRTVFHSTVMGLLYKYWLWISDNCRDMSNPGKAGIVQCSGYKTIFTRKKIKRYDWHCCCQVF